MLDILRLWRPTPLVRAARLEQALGTPARIYFKDESVSPAGSHKPNTAVPQAFYNAQEGITRLSTETGAGQWGTALAFACAQFDLDLQVYMVRASYEQKPYRRIAIETWGGRVVPSPVDDPAHPGSLGTAISDAVRDCAGRADTHYALGSVLNHVLLHQTVIGIEAREQLELAGERLPDVVIAPCGGGSNLGGIAFPFVPDEAVRLVAVEPLTCPTLTQGRFEYDFGDSAGLTPLMPMYTLGPRVRAAVDPRRRAALPRRLAADLGAGPGRADGGGGLPAGQGVRGRRAVRPDRGQDPGPGVRARHPCGDRRGAGGQGDRGGAGDPVQLLRARLPGPVRLRRLQQRPAARGAGLSVEAGAPMDGKVLLAVDGDSLVHRAFHARSGVGFRCADGRPMWAVRGLVGQLLAAVDRVDPAVVVVGFDDPVCSRRRDTWPDYKAQRGEKARPLVEQLATAVTVVAELGVPVVVPAAWKPTMCSPPRPGWPAATDSGRC